MENKKLDFLKRKNAGKTLIEKYEQVFITSGLDMDFSEHIDLEESDNLIERVREIFPMIQERNEILSDSITVSDSKLLRQAFSSAEYCYIYSDDVYYCGMYLTKANVAEDCCLNVAKFGYSNTCFLLDKELRFSIRINFYDEIHNEYKSKFDIQIKEI